jgi:orotate phosphoribosyltransferase
MRLGKHPLETAVTRVGALASLYAPLLVRGPAHVDHNRADDLAFTVARRLRGERMLVLDDTLTTGARLQSAMSGARNPVQLRSMLPVPRLSGGAKGT